MPIINKLNPVFIYYLFFNIYNFTPPHKWNCTMHIFLCAYCIVRLWDQTLAGCVFKVSVCYLWLPKRVIKNETKSGSKPPAGAAGVHVMLQ